MRSAVSMAVLRQLLGCHPQPLLELSHFLDQLTPRRGVWVFRPCPRAYLHQRPYHRRDPSLIPWVKALARGFRNQQNFINAIYFHCGGLDMDPGH